MSLMDENTTPDDIRHLLALINEATLPALVSAFGEQATLDDVLDIQMKLLMLDAERYAEIKALRDATGG